MSKYTKKSGSSPRVRGKLFSDPIGSVLRRLIPARAGKTLFGRSSPCCTSAHPRACGENTDDQTSNTWDPGSSPRVRGKLDQHVDGHPVRGLIPARAGKTPRSTTTCYPMAAHPRACGENAFSTGAGLGGLGSSPRVRGKRVFDRGGARRVGLIPARAGKTCPQSSRGSSRTAHPRACGENCASVTKSPSGSGSSPRVRGKLHTMYFLHSTGGLIPARAGKTGPPPASPPSPRAHPRACGENMRELGHKYPNQGSSPRVRGKHSVPAAPPVVPGLIPARAGKTTGPTR